ncbi:hypothetical protein BDV12DRAFT_53907 [Aspergillus spectabilis]
MSASVLGESWVVASVHPEKEDVSPKVSSESPKQISQSTSEARHEHGLGSTAASTSSMSGPELIMPSIYETPISESSWVAPNVRVKQASPNLRRRHQTSAEPTKAKEPSDAPKLGTHSITTTKAQPRFRLRQLQTPVRMLANMILLAAISHLLVFPEIVQQYQTLCSIGPFSTLYPASCISRYSQASGSNKDIQSAPFEAVTSSQTRLEFLFNATLHEIAPLNGSLKQTESQLRTVEQELKQAHPGTKHELDLEFESCWRAIRIAAWKFDSLKVDLQSAVDSLVAAGEVKPKRASTDSVAHDARLSTQMLRREQYLEQLMARMRSKADSLAADLATLDDHLESIESIVGRETKYSQPPIASLPKGSPNRHIHFVDVIVPSSVSLPSFLRARGGEQSKDRDSASSVPPKLTLSQIFHEATTHHPPVAGLARNLSKQLRQSLHSKKSIPILNHN